MNLIQPDIDPKTGRDLARLRKAAGLTQTELGELAGFGRHAVSYWETKDRINNGSPCVRGIREALGVPYYATIPRANVMGSYPLAPPSWFERTLSAQRHSLLSKSHARHRCGARTRKGTPCQALALPGKKRCKNHGGAIDGAKV